MDYNISTIDDLCNALQNYKKDNGNLNMLIRDKTCEIHKTINLHTATYKNKKIIVLDI